MNGMMQGLVNHGYLEGDTYNQFGDKRLWGGRNSIPAVGDLNGDGKRIYWLVI